MTQATPFQTERAAASVAEHQITPEAEQALEGGAAQTVSVLDGPDRLQFHQSHLGTLGKCGHKFAETVLGGLRFPPSIAMLTGIGGHAGSEINLRTKRDSGQMASEEEIRDFTRDAVVRRWNAEGVDFDPEKDGKDEAEAVGRAIDKAVALAVLHRNEVAPHVNPLYLERPFVLSIESETISGVDLAGRIDTEETDSSIDDIKTAASKPAADAIDDSDQLALYGLARHVIDKSPSAKRVNLQFLIKTKVPKAVVQSTIMDLPDYRRVLHKIERAFSAIRTGVFQPTDPNNWWCSAKFCGLAKEGKCPFKRNPTSVAL